MRVPVPARPGVVTDLKIGRRQRSRRQIVDSLRVTSA